VRRAWLERFTRVGDADGIGGGGGGIGGVSAIQTNVIQWSVAGVLACWLVVCTERALAAVAVLLICC
jgi:hypothetical protein